MKPEYIGYGNFDEEQYVYAYCQCPVSFNYALKWKRILDGKIHTYTCICEDCGTKVSVNSGPNLSQHMHLLNIINEKLINEYISKVECCDELGGDANERLD